MTAPADAPDAAPNAARTRPAPAWLASLPDPLAAPLRRAIRPGPKVSVIRLYGAIGMPGRTGSTLSDESMAQPIERAFAGKPAAVALAVNSPGGSPVQSSLIAARIRRLADKHQVPVTAFVEDAAASGGYWLAAAADDIYADVSSLVGSIGVIYAGFGLHELIARNGIERRVHTAGERKVLLDPFRPEREEDVAELRALQGEIHAAFIDHVRARRGERLARAAESGTDLFTGQVWTGARAEGLGLIDGIGHLAPVMRARWGDEARFRDCGPKRPFLSRLGLSEAAVGAVDGLEARALWSRLGV